MKRSFFTVIIEKELVHSYFQHFPQVFRNNYFEDYFLMTGSRCELAFLIYFLLEYIL